MGRGHIPFFSLRKVYMLRLRKVKDPYPISKMWVTRSVAGRAACLVI